MKCTLAAFFLLSFICLAQEATQQNESGTASRAATPDPAETPGEQHSLTWLLEGKGFASVPPGEFIMGSANGNPDEAPPHRVRITTGFEIMKSEVTQAQWKAVMDSPHAKSRNQDESKDVNPSHFKGLTHPVESVSWDSVQAFIKKLNGRDEHFTYRLPTEAEWEYAARAGAKPGTVPPPAGSGWCAPAAGGKTHPIAQHPPNAWGLHDMLGNVMEWVEDWYGPDYYERSPASDPHGPTPSSIGGGQYKVYRGGAWLSETPQCRASFRGFDFPNTGYYSVGFRLARTPK